MMKSRFLLQGVAVCILALAAVGCGDDGEGHSSNPTPTPVSMPTPTATYIPPPGGRPVEALPPGPLPMSTTCDSTADECDHARTSLLAVAHAYTAPDDTVLYRVTVDAASTGTDWGDGTNGFFYQAVVNGSTTSTYVPFNGMAVGDDNRPMLPQFSFIVAADVTKGEANTVLEIDLCTTDYAGGSTDTPPCTNRLWTDTYGGLPVPSVGLGPADDPFFSTPDVLFDEETGTSVTMPNNGVYPGVLEVCPTLNGASCAAAGDLSDSQLKWFYDHLLFFDSYGEPYTNDIFDDSSANHRSIGVLSLVEAAYPVSATTYRTRYGSTTPITARDLPTKQFFFYTTNASSTGITVGVQYLYDIERCNGYLNGQDCGPPGNEPPSITPAATISPLTDQPKGVTAFSADQHAAGTVETRTINFQKTNDSATCTDAVNPLAVNPFGAAADAGDLQPNRPNYVIDEYQNSKDQWTKRFPRALYYVLPAGFGNCDPNQEPFCHLTSNYVAYVPQYTVGSNGGVLNGGSTDEPFVDGLNLADQYALPGISTSDRNSLVWFDNCGYGYVYEECKGTVSCDNSLGLGVRQTLPAPPNNGKTYTYTVTNSRPGAVVFGKECCASWYQQLDQNTTVMVPPVQIHDGFGVFIASKQIVTYQTLFGDEAIVAYDAATGNRLHKLRLNAQARSAVYGCADASCDASPAAAGCPAAAVTGSNASFTVQLTDSGAAALACAPVGPCPLGMTPGEYGAYTTCTETTSSFLFGIDEWAAENLAGVASVQLRAWGAPGRPGMDYQGIHHVPPGAGGASGLALTVLSAMDLSPAYYAYVGAASSADTIGGTSTVLSTQPLSSIPPSTNLSTALPGSVDIVLIGGGGGGGGSNLEDSAAAPGDGGAGGIAVSNGSMSSPVSTGGADGGSASFDEFTYSGGKGGGPDGAAGAAGSAGSDAEGPGTQGIGGLGSRGNNSNWGTAGLIPPAWSFGNGGRGSSGGGGGGGGYGGGGGAVNGNYTALGPGGGGGGSWAAASTAEDPYGPPYKATPSNPSSSTGAVQLAYVPRSGTKNIAARAQLTTPSHPQPTDCLQTADAGVVLTAQNHDLIWGNDGYLQLYDSAGTSIWKSPNSVPGYQFCFQYDGNLVIYGSSGVAWASNTDDNDHGGNGGLWMRLDSSCNLIVVNASQDVLFQTNSTCVVTKARLTTPSHPQPTDCLGTADAGLILTSRYQDFVWGADGYLVLYDASHAPIWRSPNSVPGTEFCFQGDGNLVIYGSSGIAWASNTDDNDHGGNGGYAIHIDQSCRMVIVDASGNTLFATDTSCTSPPLS